MHFETINMLVSYSLKQYPHFLIGDFSYPFKVYDITKLPATLRRQFDIIGNLCGSNGPYAIFMLKLICSD